VADKPWLPVTDTQWPQYIVFHQEGADSPHEYAGAVHAPDAELALTNARDVFVRRPDCVSLWVVREDRIFARTAEELALDPRWADGIHDAGQPATWLVFQKLNHRGTLVHAGEVEAGTPEGALITALTACANPSAIVWWVTPDRAVIRSEPGDIAEMFEIAKSKRFRDQGEYHIVTAMRKIGGGDKS